MADCIGITKKGLPCKAGPEHGHLTCPNHRDAEPYGTTRQQETHIRISGSRLVGVADETTACYQCGRYLLCEPHALNDGTAAWLCEDHTSLLEPRFDRKQVSGGQLFA